MDREESSALVGAVQEIAAAVQRMEAELKDFRKETRDQLARLGAVSITTT